MRRFLRPLFLTVLLAAAAALIVPFLGDRARGEQPVSLNVAAPDFEGIDTWINAKPQTWKDLKGQVVVVHFWTFG